MNKIFQKRKKKKIAWVRIEFRASAGAFRETRVLLGPVVEEFPGRGLAAGAQVCLGQSLCPRHHLCSRLCPSEGQAFQRLQGGFHHPLLCPTSLPTVLPVPVSAKQAPYTLTHMHAHLHTHRHTLTHSHTPTYTHTHAHTLTYSLTQTHTDTHSHTFTQTHTQSHSLTHTSLLRAPPCPPPFGESFGISTTKKQHLRVRRGSARLREPGSGKRHSDSGNLPLGATLQGALQGVSCSPRQPHCRGQRPAEQ